MSESKMREEFEVWASGKLPLTTYAHGGKLSNDRTLAAWEAWQAREVEARSANYLLAALVSARDDLKAILPMCPGDYIEKAIASADAVIRKATA